MREIRLLPLVIVAVAALLMLKGVGLIVGEPHLIGGSEEAMAQDTAATQEAAAQPEGQDQAAARDTASEDAAQPAQDAAAEDAAGQDTASPDGTEDAASRPARAADQGDGQNTGKPAEEAKADEASFLERVLGGESRSRDAILESLSTRREELEAREKELDLRENLLKAAEERLEQRVGELKDLEARITAVERERKAEDDERMKNVVIMYENMKPKDAARIFNKLDMSVVVRVASLMSARQMALVLAEMESDAAQRLTLELSAKPADPIAGAAAGSSVQDLPKIVGTRPAN